MHCHLLVKLFDEKNCRTNKISATKQAMNSLIVASLLILRVSSQTCNDFGYFIENNGECMFWCSTDSDYIPITDLTFDFFKSLCITVSGANLYYPDHCNSLQDLVFRNNSCGCPYCQCINQDGSSSVLQTQKLITDGPLKTCYNCTCSIPPSSYGINESMFHCDDIIEARFPSDWNDYKCPPETCSSSHELGDIWWDDVDDSDTLCTKFCYCSPSEGEICETGYGNIMANEKLSNAFLSECGVKWSAGDKSGGVKFVFDHFDVIRLTPL